MGRFLLTQMAAVAELEAGLIGVRTKNALAAARLAAAMRRGSSKNEAQDQSLKYKRPHFPQATPLKHTPAGSHERVSGYRQYTVYMRSEYLTCYGEVQ